MRGLTGARCEVERLIREAPGKVGIVAKEHATGEEIRWAAGERFPAASLIKIPVLIEAFRQEQEGTLSLDETLPIRLEDRVGGFGVLKEMPSLTALSLRDLLVLMTVISDNTAANLCISRVGMAAVNATCRSLGFGGTILQRRMMDTEARERGLDNFTTPADMAALLEMLAGNRILTPGRCGLAIEIMKRQQVNDRLPLLLPAGTPVAHKTGELGGVRHDVGIVYAPAGPLVVAVLTSGFGTPLGAGLIGGEASALIAHISSLIYEAAAG
jgi:beta-lactamase class A